MLSQISEISVPSKVFLAGEYLAVLGGPALVAAVEPRFTLSFADGLDKKTTNPFHEDSLAGKFWDKNSNFFQNYELKFSDPHHGLGGFGGSSAEFALLHSLLDLKKSLCEESQSQIDFAQVVKDYRDLAPRDGAKPSGADLIGQLNGYLTLFERETGKINQFSWLFQDLGFMIFRTNKKLKTHEHLRSLKEFPKEGLETAMRQIQQALVVFDRENFVNGMKKYGQELETLGFVADSTREILSQITLESVLAKKGCGAMGVDVICLIDQPTQGERARVVEVMKNMGCDFVGNEMTLSGGLRTQVVESGFRFSQDVIL